MRVIFAGPRDYEPQHHEIAAAVKASGWVVDFAIAGGARGVDTVAIEWAASEHIPHHVEPAQWERYGRNRAGAVRNRVMEKQADALIALWDGISRGTRDMIGVMVAARKPVYIHGIRGRGCEFRVPVPAGQVLRVRNLYDF